MQKLLSESGTVEGNYQALPPACNLPSESAKRGLAILSRLLTFDESFHAPFI